MRWTYIDKSDPRTYPREQDAKLRVNGAAHVLWRWRDGSMRNGPVTPGETTAVAWMPIDEDGTPLIPRWEYCQGDWWSPQGRFAIRVVNGLFEARWVIGWPRGAKQPVSPPLPSLQAAQSWCEDQLRADIKPTVVASTCVERTDEPPNATVGVTVHCRCGVWAADVKAGCPDLYKPATVPAPLHPELVLAVSQTVEALRCQYGITKAVKRALADELEASLGLPAAERAYASALSQLQESVRSARDHFCSKGYDVVAEVLDEALQEQPGATHASRVT